MFRYHATMVDLGHISISALNSVTTKTPVWYTIVDYISYRLELQTTLNFVLKFSNFHCHGKKGRS